MSRSQDKLQKVADEISELLISGCLCIFIFTLTPHILTSPHPHTPPPHIPTPSHPHTFTLLCTEEKYSREVHIITVDFSDGLEIYPQIMENLQDLNIGILGEDIIDFHPHDSSTTPSVVKRAHTLAQRDENTQ